MRPKVSKTSLTPSLNEVISYHIHISPNSFLIMPEKLKRTTSRYSPLATRHSLPAQNATTNDISQKSRRKLKKAIGWLVAAADAKLVKMGDSDKFAPFKVNFITLTLPFAQNEKSDKWLKKHLLSPWIKRMAYKFDLKNYVWRAEKQKNGNLHFHLVTDTYIHYSIIRSAWNSIIIKLGLMRDFALVHGHSNPNSTDVKSVKHVKNLAQYLIKYLSKPEKDTKGIEGRYWGCNYALSTSNKCSVSLDPTEFQTFITSFSLTEFNAIPIETTNTKTGEIFTIATLYGSDSGLLNSSISPLVKRKLLKHINAIKNWSPSYFSRLSSLRSAKKARIKRENTTNPRAMAYKSISRKLYYQQLDLFINT